MPSTEDSLKNGEAYESTFSADAVSRKNNDPAVREQYTGAELDVDIDNSSNGGGMHYKHKSLAFGLLMVILAVIVGTVVRIVATKHDSSDTIPLGKKYK